MSSISVGIFHLDTLRKVPLMAGLRKRSLQDVFFGAIGEARERQQMKPRSTGNPERKVALRPKNWK